MSVIDPRPTTSGDLSDNHRLDSMTEDGGPLDPIRGEVVVIFLEQAGAPGPDPRQVDPPPGGPPG
jgi:hypothetical protein